MVKYRITKNDIIKSNDSTAKDILKIVEHQDCEKSYYAVLSVLESLKNEIQQNKKKQICFI